MEGRKLSGASGAEMSGLDLAGGLSRDDVAQVRRAVLDHLLIFLRKHDLTLEQFSNFAHAMGTPVEYPFVKGRPGYPHVIDVKKPEPEKVNFGGIWHSDTPSLEEPPMGSVRLSREVPPGGGDTIFANRYRACETLSTEMKRLVDPLTGIGSSAKAQVSKPREDRIRSDGKTDTPVAYRAEHPIVRVHPQTGRRAPDVNVGPAAGIKGMPNEDSAPLLLLSFHASGEAGIHVSLRVGTAHGRVPGQPVHAT